MRLCFVGKGLFYGSAGATRFGIVSKPDKEPAKAFLGQCRSCTILGHFIYENGMCCRLVFFVVKFSLEIQRQSLGQGEIPYRRYSPRACMVIVIKPDDKELSLQPGHDLV